MFLEKYTYHFKQGLMALLDSRGLASEFANLPALGFVVCQEDTIVCAGFLRDVERGPYILDSLISNQKIGPGLRNEAMNLLWPALIAAAGDRDILGFTIDCGTRQRAEANGFAQLPYTLLKRGAPFHS